ncbi:MAG: cytidylate kinase-like family protein [Candidatus Limivivens sp.]|nr:cytidylate kinase-like family protein [Candidatus Limivivens sp.]
MAYKTIVTIGRQYGSGGKEIGMKLAEKLGVKCYDKELLDRAAKDSGLCQELFENHDEKPTSSFLYSLVMDTYSTGYTSAAFADMPINHKIFLAQFNSIKELAKEGPCIIVGRCADYALAEDPNLLSVFINAKMDVKIRRIASKYSLTDAKAKDLIVKTDKKRASYYNYYSNKKWGDAASYNYCLDSGYLGIDGTVDLLKHLVDMKEGKA